MLVLLSASATECNEIRRKERRYLLSLIAKNKSIDSKSMYRRLDLSRKQSDSVDLNENKN